MRHYHYIFEAHNGIMPGTGGLLEPVTLDLVMENPDLPSAEDKAASMVARAVYQLEKIYEHDPDLEEASSLKNQHESVFRNSH